MSAHRMPPTDRTTPTASGPGRLIVAVYGVLALAATARSSVQIVRDLDEAPLAYLLSALAAVVYLLATVALARGGRWRPMAWGAVATEMVGVVVVGALSIASPKLFPDATVWSGFGQGYAYVPLLLPVAGLWWLARTRPRAGGPDR
jgi:cytochrome bd-type quinol oxidase subunit 2